MARPTKKNPKGAQIKPILDNQEIIKKLEQAFAIDCTITEACCYADITMQSYYNLLEYKPELLEKFNRLRENPVLLARKTVVDGLKNNPELSLKYLERKRRSEFSTRAEISGPDGGPIQTEEVSTKAMEFAKKNGLI